MNEERSKVIELQPGESVEVEGGESIMELIDDLKVQAAPIRKAYLQVEQNRKDLRRKRARSAKQARKTSRAR